VTTFVAAAAAAMAVVVVGLRAGEAPLRRLAALDGSPAAPSRGSSAEAPALVLTALVGLHQAGVPAAAVLVVAAAALVGSWLRRRRRDSRATEARRRACIDTAYALAAELRCGQPAAAALLTVARAGGPIGAELLGAAMAAAAGGDAYDELARLADVPGCRALTAVAAAWRVVEQHGGRVADVLDRLGDGLDAEERTRGELDAALAGPRSTILVLAALPGFGVALGQSVGAHPLRLLLHGPLGWGLLTTALVLDLAGAAWVRRLTRGALRP
jgi:tight adherence protein B